MWSKCIKHYFFVFYYHYTWVELICLACLIFQLPWWAVRIFWAQGLFKGTIYSSFGSLVPSYSSTKKKKLCVVKRTTNFKEHLSVTSSISDTLWSRVEDSKLKFSKILDLLKHYKKMFVMKEFLRKDFSLYFDFFLTNFRFRTQTPKVSLTFCCASV